MRTARTTEDGAGGGARGPWHAAYANPNGSLERNERGEAAFVPRRLPPSVDFDSELRQLQIEAERGVAELKGMGEARPNPEMLIRACINREAVFSSRIEGIDAAVGELIMHDAIGGAHAPSSGGEGQREALCCARALDRTMRGVARGERGLDTDLVLQAHSTLMGGAAGMSEPGRLRTAQNYIVRFSGGRGEVRYVPPPHGSVPRLLGDMMEFLRATPDGRMSGIVQCAMAHYQFEAVHPFMDGNGRVGRILIPAIFRLKGVLPDPLLCLSAYFERHREEYYARLRGVSEGSEWTEWLRFFMEAVASQAREAIGTIWKLENLRARYERTLSERSARPNARLLLRPLLANPYTTVPRACKDIGRTYPAGKKAVAELVEAGILRQVEARYSGRVFYAEEAGAIIGRE